MVEAGRTLQMQLREKSAEVQNVRSRCADVTTSQASGECTWVWIKNMRRKETRSALTLFKVTWQESGSCVLIVTNHVSDLK